MGVLYVLQGKTNPNGRNDMYKNFGDRNFFEYGILLDNDHSDTEFSILFCTPLFEEDESGNQLYLFADCYVDIMSEWFDLEAIESCCGSWDSNESLAIAALNYYGSDEFSDYYETGIFTAEEIVEKLRKYFVDYSNLVLAW